MKHCSDCQSFRRPGGVGWCNTREATPQPWLAETCDDFEQRDAVKCERCAALEDENQRGLNLLDLYHDRELAALARVKELEDGIESILPSAKPWPHQTMYQIYSPMFALLNPKVTP